MDTVTAAVHDLQHSFASLADRADALHRRCIASQCTLTGDASLLTKVSTIRREAVALARQSVSFAAKEWEAAAEEVRVRAAQLAAYAEGLEREAEGRGPGEGRGAEEAARALLCCPDWNTAGFVAVCCATAVVLHAGEAGVCVRDGLDPARCSVSGDGIKYFQAGDNVVVVVAVDSDGVVVESIEAGDVCVSVEGASVISVGVGEAAMEVVYRVPEGRVAPLTLGLSVCDAVLPGSPWSMVCPLGDSAILASVGRKRRAAFLRELSGWLPRRAYTLLYRGSRDGMTAAAFHRLCDGKGPTVVLVRSVAGWVFGGHAGASWESPPVPGRSKYVASPDAFLFSVTGPHTDAPVRFPVKPDLAACALYCHAGFGPAFNGGLYVKAANESPTACFNGRGSGKAGTGSYSTVGSLYEDVIGQGDHSLTGTERFNPIEVEVYALSRGPA